MKRKASLLIIMVIMAGLLAACGAKSNSDAFPTPVNNPNAGKIPFSTPGPVPNTKVNFPLDEAPHDVLTEWWYYTGHVTTTDGSRYGIQFVIFQGVRADFPIGYAAHFAVTDASNKTFKFEQQLDAVDRTKVKFGGNNGFDLAAGGWTLKGVGGTDQVKAKFKDNSFGLDLTVKDIKGIALHGGGQFSYGPGGASYYYSRPRMAASGTVTVGNETKTIKDGTIWFDHQWGDFLPTNGGWDWISTQLDDGSELMLYYLRDAEGKLLQSFGTYMPPCNGACTPNQPIKSIDLDDGDFAFKATGQWTSPATGTTYPSGWNLTIKAKQGIPALNLSYKPVVPNAELDTRATTAVVYWEGDNIITGTKDGKPISGSGYVELTGYASSNK